MTNPLPPEDIVLDKKIIRDQRPQRLIMWRPIDESGNWERMTTERDSEIVEFSEDIHGVVVDISEWQEDRRSAIAKLFGRKVQFILEKTIEVPDEKGGTKNTTVTMPKASSAPGHVIWNDKAGTPIGEEFIKEIVPGVLESEALGPNNDVHLVKIDGRRKEEMQRRSTPNAIPPQAPVELTSITPSDQPAPYAFGQPAVSVDILQSELTQFPNVHTSSISFSSNPLPPEELTNDAHGMVRKAIDRAVRKGILLHKTVNPEGHREVNLLSTPHCHDRSITTSDTEKRAQAQCFQFIHCLNEVSSGSSHDPSPVYCEGSLHGPIKKYDRSFDGYDALSQNGQRHFYEHPDRFVTFVDFVYNELTNSGSIDFAMFSSYANLLGLHEPDVMERVQYLVEFFYRKETEFFDDFQITIPALLMDICSGKVEINGNWFDAQALHGRCEEMIELLKKFDASNIEREEELVHRLEGAPLLLLPTATIGIGHENRVIDLCIKRNLRLRVLRPVAAIDYCLNRDNYLPSDVRGSCNAGTYKTLKRKSEEAIRLIS